MSAEMWATCSIVAGCGSATRLLRGFFLPLLADFKESFPLCSLTVWVDDFTVGSGGICRFAARRVAEAAALLCRRMVADGLKVSTKSEAIGT